MYCTKHLKASKLGYQGAEQQDSKRMLHQGAKHCVQESKNCILKAANAYVSAHCRRKKVKCFSMWSLKTSQNEEVLGKIFQGLFLLHLLQSAHVKQSRYFPEVTFIIRKL